MPTAIIDSTSCAPHVVRVNVALPPIYNLLRRYIGALLHERAYGEPERVQQGELVLEDLGLPVARMGVLPLVGAEPADT